MLLALLVLWALAGCIAVRQRDTALEESKRRPDIATRLRLISLNNSANSRPSIKVFLNELLARVETYKPRYYVFCINGSSAERIKRSELASVAWESPLRLAKVNCAPQDEKLAPVDLSSLARPDWVRRLKTPVGRCPTRLVPVEDPNRNWPKTLIGVECACERSRCTLAGPHRCLTVYIIKIVIVSHRPKETLIPIDCLCAAQVATFVKSTKPQLVM